MSVVGFRLFRSHGRLLAIIILPLLGAIESASPAAAQEEKVVIGYVARDLNNFPLLLAEARGFFREAGIVPQLVQMRSTVGLAGLQSGSIDYYTAFVSAIRWAAQGVPLMGVLAMVDKPNFYLVSRPEIRTVADLRGKIVGVGSIGDINYIVTQKVLAHFGLGPTDLTIMAAGDFPLRMTALKSGAIQATMAAPPAPIIAKEWGFNVLAFSGDFVDYPLAGLATTTSKLKGARSEVVSVIAAILRGLLFIKANRTETVSLIQKLLKMENKVAGAAYDLSFKSYSFSGSASDQGLRNVIDLVQTSAPTRQVTPEDVVDFGPLREAQAAVGIK
jgi:ABC-type nitrate/sulfonate/bicarbonate transport system substrate-binding protein